MSLTQDAQDEQVVLESMFTVGQELIKINSHSFKLKTEPYDSHEVSTHVHASCR